jgi:hypothetical protein
VPARTVRAAPSIGAFACGSPRSLTRKSKRADVGLRGGLASGGDEGARRLFGGSAAAGLSGVRGLPRGRRAGGGPGSFVAALPAARGVLRRPGRSCLAGNRPVGRHRRRTVAIVEPEPTRPSTPTCSTWRSASLVRPTCGSMRRSCGPSTPGPSTTISATTAISSTTASSCPSAPSRPRRWRAGSSCQT